MKPSVALALAWGGLPAAVVLAVIGGVVGLLLGWWRTSIAAWVVASVLVGTCFGRAARLPWDDER